MIDISRIQDLIAEGEIRQAFEMVQQHADDIPQSQWKDFLLLRHQFERINRERLLNISDGPQELNRTIYGFFEWLNDLGSDQKDRDIVFSDQEQSAILNINEAKLIYELNQPFLQSFQGVLHQISEALQQSGLPDDFPTQLRKVIQDLTNLKKSMDQLEQLRETNATQFIDQEFGPSLDRALDFIHKQMTWTEIENQQVLLKKMEEKFLSKQRKQHLPVYLVVGFIVLIVVLFGLLVWWMSQN